MLQSLHVEQFTVFGDQRLELVDGVNLLIGENGTGKSHLLKLAYALAAVSYETGRTPSLQNKVSLQKRLAEKLVGVFRPEGGVIGRLARRVQGRSACRVAVEFRGLPDEAAIRFGFSTKSQNDVNLDALPRDWMQNESIFLPTKEVLSMFPGFAGLYRNREIAIDETYYDLCLALNLAPLRGPRLEKIKKPLGLIEKTMGGSVEREGDQFFVKQDRGGKVEVPLVAEGVRKLATLAQLVRTGALGRRGIVFWDEPESNLNPKLLRAVAEVLVVLAQQGIQVVAATHSYFLMKEMELLRRRNADTENAFTTRFVTLSLNEPKEAEGLAEVTLESGERLRDVQGIVALEEELAQFDREQEISHAGLG